MRLIRGARFEIAAEPVSPGETPAPVPGLGMAALAVLSAGCMLGPEPVRPQTVAGEDARFVNAPVAAGEPATLDRWWDRFGDRVTSDLVRRALVGNTDLRVAAARVMEARSALGVALGRRLPALDGIFSRDRSQRTFAFTGRRFSSLSTTFTLEGAVTWQLDLFGRLRSLHYAAWYRLLSSEAGRDAVLHSVIAEVVRTRADIATIQRELATARARAESFQRTYDLTAERHRNDLANSLELKAAEENLAQSEAQVPELEFQVRAARHALDVLLGVQPGTGDLLPDTLSALPPLPPPPAGVPAALLDRRPDLRETELRALAEQAEISAAIADLLPDVTISASGGYQSSELGDVFEPEGQIWSLVTQLATKLFRGGALWAEIDRARSQAEAVAAEYAGAVLNAMREVEDALVREQTAFARHAHAARRVNAAREAERFAQERQEQGVGNLLVVLEAQRRRYDAERELAQVERVAWNARVDLFLAIGGDWIGEGELRRGE